MPQLLNAPVRRTRRSTLTPPILDLAYLVTVLEREARTAAMARRQSLCSLSIEAPRRLPRVPTHRGF